MKSNDMLSAYPQVRRKIALRSVRILILSVLWVGAVTLFETMFFHEYLTEHRVPILPATLIWLILYLLGLWNIGFFSWLFDMPWEGTLAHVKYHTYSKTPGLIVNPSTVYEQTEERLKIRLPNGTTIRRTIQRHKKLDAVIYKEGDVDRFYRGTNYPFILSRKGSPAPRICVFCSDVQPYPERNTCDFCGMEVISNTAENNDT